MAAIHKRVRASGTTTYVVRWYAPDGTERVKGGFRTKKAAHDWAAIEVEPKRRRGIDVNPNAGKVLFRDVAAAWLASRHDLKDTTRAAYADALAATAEKTVKRHKRLANLRIDNTFGDYPVNTITRKDISEWVAKMKAAGKKPSTIRNAYFLVRQVLSQAVADGRLDANPADYVKLPTDHNTGHVRAVDDPAMFLTPAQVAALVAATPWPFSVMTHLAAWSGLRAAELAGLRVGDVTVPKAGLNPNASAKPGTVRVDQTIAWTGATATVMAPKTKGSRRTVPLTSEHVPPAVALAAARDMLDRAGHKPPDKVDVEVGVKPYEDLLGKVVGMSTSTRSESRARRGMSEGTKAIGAGGFDSDDVVDAEVVEDDGQETPEHRPGSPTGMRTSDGRGNGPGQGLMTLEEAQALANEANLRAGVYDKRYRK